MDSRDGSSGPERRRLGVTKTQRQLKTSSSPVLSGRRGSTSNSEWDVRRWVERAGADGARRGRLEMAAEIDT